MVEAHRVAADLPATNPLALLIGGRNPAHRRRAAALGAGILVAITAAIAAVAMAGWQGQVPVVGEDPSGVPVPALPYIVPADVLDLLGARASVALSVFASSRWRFSSGSQPCSPSSRFRQQPAHRRCTRPPGPRTCTAGNTRNARQLFDLELQVAGRVQPGASSDGESLIVDRTLASPPQGDVHAVADVDHVACAVGDLHERIHRS